MIEQLIYWTGVTALLSAAVALLAASIGIIAIVIRERIVKNLGRAYRHAQLYFFMMEIKKKGYYKAVEDAGKTNLKSGES